MKKDLPASLEMYQVDAFTTSVFGGNPAAVCPLQEWLPDETLQAIAGENNLSETAFVVPGGTRYAIRWFTPRHEVPLCGHATLASGFVILNILQPSVDSVEFDSPSGPLSVRRAGDQYTLDFPSIQTERCPSPPKEIVSGLHSSPQEVLSSIGDPNYLVIFETEDQVRHEKPDLAMLEKLHPCGVVISAPGKSVDFVSRYFMPSSGIPEDPVTGSIHCALGPYWAKRLGKTQFQARQLSKRGGELGVELRGDRVILTGSAVCFLKGTIYLKGGP